MPVSWQMGRWPSAHMRELISNLRDGVARGGRLLLLVGTGHAADEVDRVVVRDELQSVGHALDKIVLLDDGHNRPAKRNTFHHGDTESTEFWAGRQPNRCRALSDAFVGDP